MEKLLTKVALDSVLPHANANCETRTTLQNGQWERKRWSENKVHECDRNAFERGKTCTAHTEWPITATGLIGGYLVVGNGLQSP
jgi:hypothetical protein